MDKRKIYIIYNKSQFSKEFIISELKKEEYSYRFLFCDGANVFEYLKYTDEVWTWGDMKNNQHLKLAKTLNKDIWEMG